MPKKPPTKTTGDSPAALMPARGGVYELDPAANTLTQLEGLPEPIAPPPAPTAQPEGTSDEN